MVKYAIILLIYNAINMLVAYNAMNVFLLHHYIAFVYVRISPMTTLVGVILGSIRHSVTFHNINLTVTG